MRVGIFGGGTGTPRNESPACNFHTADKWDESARTQILAKLRSIDSKDLQSNLNESHTQWQVDLNMTIYGPFINHASLIKNGVPPSKGVRHLFKIGKLSLKIVWKLLPSRTEPSGIPYAPTQFSPRCPELFNTWSVL